MRTLTYFVAVTLDGYCCGPDGSFDFFPIAEDCVQFLVTEYPETLPSAARGALGIDAVPNRHYDTILQGRGSYQLALDANVTSPYAHANQVVFSATLDPGTDPAVTIVPTDPCAYVRGLKEQDGPLGLALLGGPEIAGVLLPEIDELVIKRYPVLAGAGKPMVAVGFRPQNFDRVSSHSFDSGADFSTFRRV